MRGLLVKQEAVSPCVKQASWREKREKRPLRGGNVGQRLGQVSENKTGEQGRRIKEKGSGVKGTQLQQPDVREGG